MVVLILENEQQMKYYKRIKKIGDKYGITAEYVTNEILKLDENDRCFNLECKCNKDIRHNKMQQNSDIVV